MAMFRKTILRYGHVYQETMPGMALPTMCLYSSAYKTWPCLIPELTRHCHVYQETILRYGHVCQETMPGMALFNTCI